MRSLMGKRLAVFQKKLSFNPRFFWLKLQKYDFILRKMVLSEVFIKF